ncbi:hypothetical protein NMG60_11024118 [Bertholletia excelsa]
MASASDPMVVRRFIGDVVDVFAPSINMSVYYGNKHITNGCNIKPSTAKNAPRVTIDGQPHEFFTLVMVDPDVPSPSEPILREWVTWLVTNIPGGSSATRGNEVLPYIGLRPAAGIHHNILVLFKQKTPLGLVERCFRSRANFNTRAFAQQQGMGEPVATVYFNSQREPKKQKR